MCIVSVRIEISEGLWNSTLEDGRNLPLEQVIKQQSRKHEGQQVMTKDRV